MQETIKQVIKSLTIIITTYIVCNTLLQFIQLAYI